MKVDALTLQGTAMALYEREGGTDFWGEPIEVRIRWLQRARVFWMESLANQEKALANQEKANQEKASRGES